MSTIAVKKVKLGDNADLSKNFLVEVPAVADGTLTIKRENGTSVLSIDAAGKAVIPGVVGTVAQVGGIPTGQIVERGSNANGEYVRFADGTQICSLFNSTATYQVTWTFPATYSHTPGVNLFIVSGVTSINVFVLLAGAPSTTSVAYRKKYAAQTSGSSWKDAVEEPVMCFAIGRWF